MKELCRRFLEEQDGTESTEYAVIVALVVAGLVVAVAGLRDAMEARFSQTTSVIAGN